MLRAPQVGSSRVIHGLNATADSFYASQGRLGGDFEDHNEQLVRGWTGGIWPAGAGLKMMPRST